MMLAPLPCMQLLLAQQVQVQLLLVARAQAHSLAGIAQAPGKLVGPHDVKVLLLTLPACHAAHKQHKTLDHLYLGQHGVSRPTDIVP